MSTQQIIPKSSERYYQEMSKITRCSANNHYVYSHFRIGEDMNFLETMYYNKLQKILCSDNCQLIDWIKQKLEGKLEECGEKKKKDRSLEELLKLVQQQTKCDNMTDACECLSQWSEISW